MMIIITIIINKWNKQKQWRMLFQSKLAAMAVTVRFNKIVNQTKK